jgi:predicted nucleic acid-binding protein
MTVRTFVDTHVWVYALDRGDPAKQSIALDAIRADPAAIVVSPQVLGELYVTLMRLGGADRAAEARRAIDALRRFTVVPIEAGDVDTALRLTEQHSISYWDALIVASARSAGCVRILTEDLAHGAELAGVRIENPFRRGRVAEAGQPYSASAVRTWDDDALQQALADYEAACEAAGMRRNAIHSYWDYARRFLDWRAGRYPRSATTRAVPAAPVTVNDLRLQAEAYTRAVRGMGLGTATVDTYERHALFFVRWLSGEFVPGSRLSTI